MTPKEIGRTIQMLRRGRRIKQFVVADALGIDRGSYGQVEQGRTACSIQRLYAIAAFFGMTAIDILKIAEDERLNPTKFTRRGRMPLAHRGAP